MKWLVPVTVLLLRPRIVDSILAADNLPSCVWGEPTDVGTAGILLPPFPPFLNWSLIFRTYFDGFEDADTVGYSRVVYD